MAHYRFETEQAVIKTALHTVDSQQEDLHFERIALENDEDTDLKKFLPERILKSKLLRYF